MNIRTTDGTLEEYSVEKVFNDIVESYKSIKEEVDEHLIRNIIDNLFVYENMTSAEIRRLVEDALMSVNKKVARAYISKYDTIDSDKNFKRKKSDYIKNYIKASNAATGSKFDANANVSSKNVVTMGTELYKEENIKENRYLLYDRIKMMYSKKLADRYIYDLETHRIYKHDETAIPGMPYTYSSKEVVEVKYGERHLFVPFDLLWNIVEEESVLVNENDNVFQKRPENLYVKDKGNIFTKVSVITKKERKRDLVRVKTAFGEDVVVTDNHPMIVNKDDINDTVDAIHSEGMSQFKIDESIVFDGKSVLDLSVCPNIEHFTEKYCMTYSHSVFKRHLILDEMFGYFVGFFVGDGNFNNSKNNGSIVITQKNRATLEKLNDILFESLGVVGIIRYKRDKTNCYSLTISNDIVWWILDEYFMIQDKSENKTLPVNIFELNENFAKGVVSGLIDSDGAINDCQLSIRLSSRSAIVQTTSLLRHFGYGVGNTIQRVPFGNNGSYKTRYTLWGVNASVRNNSVKLELCEKLKNVRVSETSLKYKKSGETTITSVEKINDEDSFLGLNDFIYDITTDTRTFSCNNILVHNCVAITMYPFLLDGLTGLGGQSKAPTDLKSYCGEFINLVYSVSSQFAGACMYKDQELFIKNKKTGITKKITSKELVNEKLFGNVGKFSNFQGDWEYAYVDDLCVAEDGKFVDVNKVYRRKYNGDIYIIKTKDGRTAYVSKDHKFKVFYRGRILEVKAEDLVVNDTVFVNKDFSFIVDDTVDDYKRGWIKGIICGDGCIKNENEVRLALHKDQLYYGDIFNKYSLSLYNNSLTTIREDSRGGNCFDYSKYNKEFYQNVCCDIIGKSTYDKHIDVDNKSVDFLLGFIDGLLCADGSYTKSKGVTISLTNEKLINNVADIIHMMGYERPTINLIHGKGNRKDSYTLYIRSTFLKYLKHTHLKKLELDNVGDSRMNEISIYGSTALKNTKTNKRNLWSGSHRSENYNLDVIESIEKFHNDDDYVYEIETDTHWYNCGGFITHNCATPEFLMYFDYFVRKDYGDDYLLHLNDKVELNAKGRTLEQVIENGFQQVVHSMNMPAGNRGYQTVFWNVGYFDKGYFEGVFGDFKFPDGTSPKWETLSWLQKKFMKWFNEERTKYTLTFPVETMACLTDGNDLVDEEYADFTSEMYADGHSFFTYLSDSPDSLSSCCRLRNSLKDNEDEEHNHNTHQFSMGTASVATGSKSVMTINLNRIIQNSVVEYFEEMGSKFQLGCKFVLSEQSEDVKQGVINKIKSNITECTENVHKYQTAFNSIIKDFYEANMLDVYRAGFINMRKQYLTVGVNGLTDAAEFLGIDCTDNDNYREFVNDILETINISNKKDKTRECMFNTEFVPGENLSNKNYNWDKKDGYFVSEKHIMYSSYFFNPEDDSLSVLEKMRLHGKDYVQYLDGGSACHINLAEHLSKEQNRKLLKYAASVGCNYFTYNVRNTACNKCGYISKHDLDKCPHCGSTDVDKLTRIIGYLKRVKSFAEPRQVEEGMRYYNKTVE